MILNAAPTVEVVGTAYEGSQAVEMAGKLTPDLVLMDLKMPGMKGIHATRAIYEQYPGTYVLVLTTFDADEWVFDAIRAGAAGYLLKDSSGGRNYRGHRRYRGRRDAYRPDRGRHADDLSATASRAGHFHRR